MYKLASSYVYFRTFLADFNSYCSKVRAHKASTLRAANRSLMFSTVVIQMKEKSANNGCK